MHAIATLGLVVSLAAPDPRTIDPDAARPDIVTDGETTTPVVPTTPPPPPTTTDPPPIVPDRPPDPSGTSGGTPTPPTTTPPPSTTPATTPSGGQPTVDRPPPEPEPNVDRTQKCFAAHGRCRRLSIAGYTTLGVGALLLGTGIAFTQITDTVIQDEPVFNRSFSSPGKALVSVGVISLLAGGILVGAGVAVHRKFQSGEERLAKVRLDARGLHW